MSNRLTAKEVVGKLILYTEHKKKWDDGDESHYRPMMKLKAELLAESVDIDLLNMSGHDLENRIYESIQSQIRR